SRSPAWRSGRSSAAAAGRTTVECTDDASSASRAAARAQDAVANSQQSMRRVETWPRTILHVDLDAFYTSVHQRDDPALRGRPVAVAGRSRRAAVMGASFEARRFGVHPDMPLSDALERCPELTVVAPEPGRYREA